MNEPRKYAIAIGGFVVLALGHVLVAWKSAERDARKEIGKLTPPVGFSLGDASTRWLVDRLVQRTRLSAVATSILACSLGSASVAFADVPIVREAGPMYFILALGLGYLIGSTASTTISARTGATPRRSAPLAVRTPRTYLREWERRLQSASLAAAAIGLVIVGWLTIDRTLDAFYLGLATTWLILLGSLVLLQHWVLRAPPVVDEDLHVARELLIAISVRTLAIYQLIWASLLGFVGSTYLWLHSDLPWIVSIAPLYAAGGVGLVTHIVGSQRRERGLPAPEWHFARTLEPNP